MLLAQNSAVSAFAVLSVLNEVAIRQLQPIAPTHLPPGLPAGLAARNAGPTLNARVEDIADKRQKTGVLGRTAYRDLRSRF